MLTIETMNTALLLKELMFFNTQQLNAGLEGTMARGITLMQHRQLTSILSGSDLQTRYIIDQHTKQSLNQIKTDVYCPNRKEVVMASGFKPAIAHCDQAVE